MAGKTIIGFYGVSEEQPSEAVSAGAPKHEVSSNPPSASNEEAENVPTLTPQEKQILGEYERRATAIDQEFQTAVANGGDAGSLAVLFEPRYHALYEEILKAMQPRTNATVPIETDEMVEMPPSPHGESSAALLPSAPQAAPLASVIINKSALGVPPAKDTSPPAFSPTDHLATVPIPVQSSKKPALDREVVLALARGDLVLPPAPGTLPVRAPEPKTVSLRKAAPDGGVETPSSVMRSLDLALGSTVPGGTVAWFETSGAYQLPADYSEGTEPKGPQETVWSGFRSISGTTWYIIICCGLIVMLLSFFIDSWDIYFKPYFR